MFICILLSILNNREVTHASDLTAPWRENPRAYKKVTGARIESIRVIESTRAAPHIRYIILMTSSCVGVRVSDSRTRHLRRVSSADGARNGRNTHKFALHNVAQKIVSPHFSRAILNENVGSRSQIDCGRNRSSYVLSSGARERYCFWKRKFRNCGRLHENSLLLSVKCKRGSYWSKLNNENENFNNQVSWRRIQMSRWNSCVRIDAKIVSFLALYYLKKYFFTVKNKINT